MEEEIDREVALFGISRLQAYRNIKARRIIAARGRQWIIPRMKPE
jgi:hypothetical protein